MTTDPPLVQLVGGPFDGREQVVRTTRLLIPAPDSSVRWWLENAEPWTAPPDFRFAVYEVEAPDSFAVDAPTRYTFRGFE